jgi:hypothetical protein
MTSASLNDSSSAGIIGSEHIGLSSFLKQTVGEPVACWSFHVGHEPRAFVKLGFYPGPVLTGGGAGGKSSVSSVRTGGLRRERDDRVREVKLPPAGLHIGISGHVNVLHPCFLHELFSAIVRMSHQGSLLTDLFWMCPQHVSFFILVVNFTRSGCCMHPTGRLASLCYATPFHYRRVLVLSLCVMRQTNSSLVNLPLQTNTTDRSSTSKSRIVDSYKYSCSTPRLPSFIHSYSLCHLII